MTCPFRSSLEALAAGRLDPEARRALEAHLPSCPACREEAARLASLRALLGHLAPFEPQDAEWRKIDDAVLAAMDSALDRRPGWLDSFVPALSLAAAAAAVVLLTFAVRPPPAPALAPADSAPLAAALPVELGEGATVLEPGGTVHRLVSGALDEGDVVEVAGDPLTLQTAPATGARLAPGSRVALARLAEGHTALRLDAGALSAEVKPLAAGHSFQVRASDLLISVRGTAFTVAREGGRTRVEVAHGLVSVEREGQGAILVPGPGSVEIADGAALSAGEVVRQVSPETDAAFPLGLADRPLEELAPLAPRPPGLAAPRSPEPAAPAAAAPSEPARPARLRHGKAAALREAFGACLRAHKSDLDGCYDDALKTDPDFSGRLVLTVSVDPTGAVRSVEASRASRGLRSCAQQIVQRCEQPGTGEDELLELPLELSH